MLHRYRIHRKSKWKYSFSFRNTNTEIFSLALFFAELHPALCLVFQLIYKGVALLA